jgi:hypothetical protein
MYQNSTQKKIMQKKGLVFDKQNYFPKLLKKNFQEHISFDFYKNLKSFDKKLNDYSIITLVIYSEDEIYNFMKIYDKEIPLIICVFNNQRLIRLQRIDNVILLDASTIIPEIISKFRHYLGRLHLLN